MRLISARFFAPVLLGLLVALGLAGLWQVVFDGESDVQPPALSNGSELRFEGAVSGSTINDVSVSTDGSIDGELGDLYFTAVATKPARTIAVEGLNADWFHVGTQCSGRGTTAVSLWAAVAIDDANGSVTVELDDGAASIAVVSSRYSGADVDSPIGSVSGANSSRDSADCEGGADTSQFDVELERTTPGSRTVFAAATRQVDVIEDALYNTRASVRSAADGDASGLTFNDDVFSVIGDTSSSTLDDEGTIVGAMDAPTDWAVIAVEVLPREINPNDPTLHWSETDVAFGASRSVPNVPEEMGRATIEVRNEGLDELVVTALSLEGPDADQFRLVGPQAFTLERGEVQSIDVAFWPSRAANASAILAVTSNDVSPPRAPTLSGRGGPLPDGVWISAAELASKPMAGEAWESLTSTAGSDLGEALVSDFVSEHDVRTLAVALVYARTGEQASRIKARDAIAAAIGTEAATTTAVQPCRNVASYVIAADVIGLDEFDQAVADEFRTWIDEIRFVEWPDGSFVDEDEERANNHGRMCGMSRAVIASYLGDVAELEATAIAFARFLGDTTAPGESLWKHDLSWQADPENPVGINPLGARKGGFSLDGALPEEMRRGGQFQVPPAPTGYPWEALQAVVAEAVVLDRAGYDVFDWSDRAILRSVEFLAGLDAEFPDGGWWADGDDSWVPWVVNDAYGTDFPTDSAEIGKNMGWTDWTHGPS